MRLFSLLAAAFVLGVLYGPPAIAQITLPGSVLPNAGGLLAPVEQTLDRIERDTLRSARELLRDRERALARFLDRNQDLVELDSDGNPARRGEVLILDLAEADLGTLQSAGFAALGRDEIAGLGFSVTRIGLPAGLPLAEGEALIATLLPLAEVAPDNIHFPTGRTSSKSSAPDTVPTKHISTPVGIIDGAASARIGSFATRGFATGAPAPSDHGSAIAHLLSRAGVSNIRIADVYGSGGAGGNALAIARGLGWLAQEGSHVVTISLVGPRNAVVERAIEAAQRRGTVIVAAVGNDGPAAPPAYPASYAGVVAVTGVDGRNRALLEAGRALHLDYAAPGADLTARNSAGRRVTVRGTSFATPLAAARIAAAIDRGRDWRSIVDREAQDLGQPGPDTTFGRGLLCGSCRNF